MIKSKERKIISFIIIGIVTLSLSSFILFQSKNLIKGPQIIIEEPTNGETRVNSLAFVSGKALNVSEIKLNGKNIFIDEDGNFKERVLLSYGYNKVIIEAKDRFNRITTKELQLTLEE